MKKIIGCLILGFALAGVTDTVKAEDYSCESKRGLDRAGCQVGRTLHRTEDYVRENAPRWRQSLENSWHNTVESARRFGRNVREGYQNYDR